MDIFCPHCQNQLTIEDQHSGEYVRCPLCSGMFTAPALPMMFTEATPAAPQPAATSPAPSMPAMELDREPEVFSLEPMAPKLPLPAFDKPPPPTKMPTGIAPTPASPPAAPVGPPPTQAVSAAPLPPLPSVSSQPSAPVLEPIPEPLASGEYQHAFILHFNPDIIMWLAPVCLGLVFFLSFFTWSTTNSMSLWSLAAATPAIFLTYAIFMVIGLALAVACLLLSKRLIVLPEPIKKLRPWRSLIVAGVVLFAFLFLFFHWVHGNFNLTATNPTTVWYKFAVRLHFLAVVGPLLEFWLDRRHKKNLPLPKIELRW